MNKVINFINNDNNYNELQLKLIAYNIIEYAIKIANKAVSPDIDPDTITVTKTNEGFFCNYECITDRISEGVGNSKTLLQNIEIDTTFNDYIKYDNYMTEVRNFARTYGITNDILAIFVFVTLHECGHMVNNEYIFQRMKGKFEYYNAMQSNLESTIFMTFDRYIEDGEYDCAFDYNFNPVEAQANIFAYKHFKEVWDMLVYKGLI